MVSRYFVYNNPELRFQPDDARPTSPDYKEVTNDGRLLTHLKDGSVYESTDQLRVPALEACMRYVQQGNWVEIAFDENGRRYVVVADVPAPCYGDHW